MQIKTKIDKFVEYAIKNGPQFEAITRDRQVGQPGWEFLNNGEHSGYYRFRLYQSWKAQVRRGEAHSFIVVIFCSAPTFVIFFVGGGGGYAAKARSGGDLECS